MSHLQFIAKASSSLLTGLLALLLAAFSPASSAQQPASAIFAAGCFWCAQTNFEKLPGVIRIEAGYIGGHTINPTYEQVRSGTTGHAEAVRITYDPARISYRQLLDHFWHNIDPTTNNRQFCNLGTQYRTGIHYLNDIQRQEAIASKIALEQSGVLRHVSPPVAVASSDYPPEFQLEAQRHAEADAQAEASQTEPGKVATEIVPAGTFYLAEERHQAYHHKNPLRFKIYRLQCGRDARLNHIWGNGQNK
ncbi:MAG: peptide methionine sulfoxide reductase [Burkholderiaceae bacterium]|nr:peptide methionine sulfoxide reductase [Burkholderiaceae bacterium]